MSVTQANNDVRYSLRTRLISHGTHFKSLRRRSLNLIALKITSKSSLMYAHTLAHT